MYGVQLLQRLGLGGVAHPSVLRQSLLKGLLQVFHQTVDTLLAGLGEIFCHVELADGLAQIATDDGDGTLPAGLLLLHAANGLAGLERTVCEGIAEETAVSLDDLNLHIGLQVLDTCLSQHLLHLVQRFQLIHIHHVDILRIAEGVAIAYPIDTTEVLQQLLPRHHMDDLLRVAPVHLVQCLHANPVLHGPCCLHHALGVGIAVAHHFQEVLVQALEGIHDSLLLLVGLGIVLLG